MLRASFSDCRAPTRCGRCLRHRILAIEFMATARANTISRLWDGAHDLPPRQADVLSARARDFSSRRAQAHLHQITQPKGDSGGDGASTAEGSTTTLVRDRHDHPGESTFRVASAPDGRSTIMLLQSRSWCAPRQNAAQEIDPTPRSFVHSGAVIDYLSDRC